MFGNSHLRIPEAATPGDVAVVHRLVQGLRDASAYVIYICIWMTGLLLRDTRSSFKGVSGFFCVGIRQI